MFPQDNCFGPHTLPSSELIGNGDPRAATTTYSTIPKVASETALTLTLAWRRDAEVPRPETC